MARLFFFLAVHLRWFSSALLCANLKTSFITLRSQFIPLHCWSKHVADPPYTNETLISSVAFLIARLISSILLHDASVTRAIHNPCSQYFKWRHVRENNVNEASIKVINRLRNETWPAFREYRSSLHPPRASQYLSTQNASCWQIKCPSTSKILKV